MFFKRNLSKFLTDLFFPDQRRDRRIKIGGPCLFNLDFVFNFRGNLVLEYGLRKGHGPCLPQVGEKENVGLAYCTVQAKPFYFFAQTRGRKRLQTSK